MLPIAHIYKNEDKSSKQNFFLLKFKKKKNNQFKSKKIDKQP